MKHPHRDWEYEFRDEFPGATDEQVRQAWEREQKRDASGSLPFGSKDARMAWHDGYLIPDDEPPPYAVADETYIEDEPAEWEREHGPASAAQDFDLGDGRVSPSDLETIAEAYELSAAYHRWGPKKTRDLGISCAKARRPIGRSTSPDRRRR